MIEEWTRQHPKKHVNQLPISQMGLDSPCQISLLLRIFLKTFACTHGHTLELSTGRSKVSVILILLIKSSNQIFPVADVGPLQLIEPFKLSLRQTVLKEMDPQVPISSVRLNLPHIGTKMKLGTRHPIIFCENRSFKFL